jgi:hypothetical protein
MIEADTVYFFPFYKVKDIIKLFCIMLIYSKSQTNALTNRNAVSDALHGSLVSAFLAAEHVVDILQAIQ